MQTEKKGQSRKADPRKLAVRIIAWVLILMTIITTLYTAIYFIVEEVSASEPEELNVAVGLVYGDSVDEAFTSTTTVGYTVGSEKTELNKKTFTPLWTIPDTTKVTILADCNYTKKTIGNSYIRSDSDVVVGGYHIELDAVYDDTEKLTEGVSSVNSTVSGKSLYAIPSYINGELKIRIGSYATKAAADAALAELQPLFTELTMHVVSPSSTGVTVVAHNTSKLLFEYDCADKSYLALDPLTDEAYTATPAGNIYDGVFVYKHYVNSSKNIDGIQVVNVLPLEKYLLGVVPYEISNSWPLETLKAFSVLARTYAVAEFDQYWNSYGFNLCNTASSQVYRGVARANANVIKAVEETAGLVVACNGVIASTYYSSSVGDSTVDSRYIWGKQDLPWLRSVATPWEEYRDHAKAFWTKEVSPTELQKYLYSNGYTKLTAPIASIKINQKAGENSNYVYKLTVTDEANNSVTIERTDKVKSAFSAYLNSANFVVAKGSVTYTTYNKLVAPGEPSEIANSSFAVMTSLGKLFSTFENGVKVLTSNGEKLFLPSSAVGVVTADSYKNGTIESISESYIVTETATATDPNNFIFVGKGWGHGIGLSQWGLYDLAAKFNLKYDEMIRAYCGDVQFVDYEQFIKK